MGDKKEAVYGLILVLLLFATAALSFSVFSTKNVPAAPYGHVSR